MATAKQLCDVMKAHPDTYRWSVSERPRPRLPPECQHIEVMWSTTYGHTGELVIQQSMFAGYTPEAFAEEFNRGMAESRARHDSGECGC